MARARVLGQQRPVGYVADAPESGRERALWLLGAAVFTFIVVVLVGFVGLSGGVVSPPAATTVVQFEPGDTLWGLANEHAPGADTGEVVRRMVELNGLDGSVARPGEALIVPSAGR